MARKKSTATKVAEKAIKKTHTATIILAAVFFVLGCIGGVVLSKRMTQNDIFELNGSEVVRLAVGESYIEEGVTIFSFGKDISDKVIRSGDIDKLDTNIEGVYKIVYKVNDFRWKDYQRVRTVYVGNAEESLSAASMEQNETNRGD